MQIVRTIKDMQALSRKLRAGDKTIGIVPTMGALHEGHLSLISRSKNENDITVVTIFVNPVQFGPSEDFRNYPRDIEGDLSKLSPLGPDIVFLPDDKEMYPGGFTAAVNIGSIGEVLCGASRPGHFNGVATVVVKLFNIVMPDNGYFGQKDFQQTVIIKKIVTDLDYNVNIIVCPTVREHDGLAMSSRNTYLDHEERKAAPIIYKGLKLGEELILSNSEADVSDIKEQIRKYIISEPLANIDYIEVVSVTLLEKVVKINLPVAICVAVKIGKTRLIDNIIVDRK